MKRLLKVGSAALVTVISMTMVGGESLAAGDYYYNGMTDANASNAYYKTKRIANNEVSINHVSNASKGKYKAVGRVSNKDGWKGRGKDSMGTGTVIGNYTFITNAHVIDTAKGYAANPSYITFDMNRDGSAKPFTFHATKVIKVPYADVALVYTKEKLTNYAQALPIATDTQINQLQYSRNLYSVGYPWQKGDNTKSYWSKLKFIQKSSNGTELQTKDIFRAGASGSPMVDGNYRIYGLRTYGYNLWGTSTSSYAKTEMAGGEALSGSTGNYVRSHIK